jgi:hypothetical protein
LKKLDVPPLQINPLEEYFPETLVIGTVVLLLIIRLVGEVFRHQTLVFSTANLDRSVCRNIG